MYPLCLDLTNRLCVLFGGGAVAERKARALLAAQARLRLVSPKATENLQRLAAQGLLEWRRKAYDPADLKGALLVFAATDNLEIQQAITDDAHSAGLLVNSADNPEACDFQVPASLRRGDLLLTASTGGKSPAIAAFVRRRLTQEFGEEYASFTALAGILRKELAKRCPDQKEREHLLKAMLHEDLLACLRDQRWDNVDQHLHHVFGAYLSPEICTRSRQQAQNPGENLSPPAQQRFKERL